MAEKGPPDVHEHQSGSPGRRRVATAGELTPREPGGASSRRHGGQMGVATLPLLGSVNSR